LLSFLAVLGCGVWIWASPDALQQGTWPWPLIVAAGVIGVSRAVGALVRRSGRRAGRVVANAYRLTVEEQLAAQLARRVGVPIRTVVRERAELEGALAELAVKVTRAARKIS
jgi:hypothetical protein